MPTIKRFTIDAHCIKRLISSNLGLTGIDLLRLTGSNDGTFFLDLITESISIRNFTSSIQVDKTVTIILLDFVLVKRSCVSVILN